MSDASCTNCPPSDLPAASPAFSLLLDSALERIELARRSLGRGADPAQHLHRASLQIRELAASLAAGTLDTALGAHLTDLSDYICRQLRSVEDEAGLTILLDVCDLLREVRCAYVGTPAPARAAAVPATAAARM